MTCRRSRAAGLIVTVALVTAAAAPDLIAELGFSERTARDNILRAFTSGRVAIAGAGHAFKIAAPDKKVLFVKAVTGLAKGYTQTAEFKGQYAEYREANKPQPPPEIKAFGAQQAAQIEEFERQMAQLKEMMKSLPPDQQKEMQKSIEDAQREMEKMKQDPEMKAAYEEARKAEAAAGGEEYKRRMKEWEQEWPSNPDQLVANRLREFLAETKDLDYSAKLVKQGEKMRFADPKYEEKSSEWKLCFRAGREATEAARVFALEWLKELQARGVK